MSGVDVSPGGAAGLLAPIVTRAREQAPRSLNIACGLGGGGEPLVRALRAAAKDDGEGVVVDLAATAGVGPAPSVPSQMENGDWRIVLTRDTLHGGHTLANIAGREVEPRLFCELLSETCDVPTQLGAEVVDRLGCPTALISDLATGGIDWSGAEAGDLLKACWELSAVVAMRETMNRDGGHALLDLGRTLCLMNPVEMELSDEWALLAAALSGRTYSTADISLVLSSFPGLFEVDRRRNLVRPSSRLARELLLGGVTPSQSEHFAIYRALRDRSVAALERADDSDHFIARQLPRQATAAAAIPTLASDPLGILSSDSLVLLAELESEPTELCKPAAKMIALCAHRLLAGPDQASHLELSARRIGLHSFADALAAELPVRRWRPLWAQAELAHTHCVALDHSSPLLDVAAVEDSGGVAFAGSADGSVWRISPYEPARRLTSSDAFDGEIRSLAARMIDGRPLVAIGTSAHVVGVLDGNDGVVAWLDTSTHQDPLSVSFIHPGDDGALLTAGVGGAIYRHPLHDGAGRGELVYRHGSEIRDVQAVEVDGTELLVFCAVDGIVGVLLYADGSPIARWHIAEDVLNSVAATVDGDELLLVAGTSRGSIRQLKVPTRSLHGDDQLRRDEWSELSTHPRAVNCVRVIRGEDGVVVLSGSSDGSWQWNDRNGTRQRALGHIGPIWSIDLMEGKERRYVITAGGEGTCRLWLTEAVLEERIANSQPLAHRGPVSAIELASDPAEVILVITGGADGDVRAAAPNLAEGGELLARHESEISALLSVSIGETRSHVVSGSVDGTLLLTSIGAEGSRESVVLGIAHEGVTSLSHGRLGDIGELVSGGMDGTITAWDLKTRVPSRTIQGCRYGSVRALCHLDCQGEGLLVVGGQDGRLNLFRGESLEPSGEPPTLEAGVLRLAPLPGSGMGLLAGLMDGRVAVVEEIGLYQPRIRYIKASNNEIRGLGTLILGGRLFLACTGLDRRLRLLDIESGEQMIDIDLDGYALTLKALGASVALGTSAGASVITYPTDMVALNP